jgi:hypothetical protein
MIKVVNKRSDGSLFHYAHFIMDCLFTEIIQDVYQYSRVIRQKTINQTIGNFSKIYEEVMQNTNVEVVESEFQTMDASAQIQTTRIDFPTKSEMDKVRDFVFRRYGIEGLRPSLNILLIQRGDRIPLIDDPFLKSINKNVSTGKERREIVHIEKIKTYLNQNYPDNYKTVILEQMPFEEQVRHFYNADVIIGIHGAGLVNTIFCKKGATLIEIQNEEFKWPFLNHSCEINGVRHIFCKNDFATIMNVMCKEIAEKIYTI